MPEYIKETFLLVSFFSSFFVEPRRYNYRNKRSYPYCFIYILVIISTRYIINFNGGVPFSDETQGFNLMDTQPKRHQILRPTNSLSEWRLQLKEKNKKSHTRRVLSVVSYTSVSEEILSMVAGMQL